jgi:hypothetical protein
VIFHLDGKNWAIGFLIVFELVFLSLAILFRLDTRHADLGKDLWGIFLMFNGALFLILNTAGKSQAGLDVPPVDTTKVGTKQTVEVTTTPDPNKEG